MTDGAGRPAQLSCASEPGTPGNPNEDLLTTVVPAFGSGGAVVLLDGVTPPAGDDGCRHGVPWFTARLGAALAELAGGHRDLALPRCLAQAIDRTADAHRGACDLSHLRTPQATAVVVRWDEEQVEYLVLSDSVLLLEHTDGTVRPVRDARLDALRARRVRGARLEALRNAEGGFFTAAADPAVADRAVTGSVPRRRVRGLAALTDGAGRWVDTFGLGGWEELFAQLAENGPAAVIGQVRAAEGADPAAVAFPRGKPSDDATAVVVRL